MRLKAKTTMKINFLVKMIMIVLFVLGAFVFFVDISKAAIWKTNLNQCPDTYGSQYSPGKALCGVDVGGNAQWVLPNEFLPNVGNVTSTAISQYGGLSNGGFVVDCEAYRSPAPYCNNSSVAGVNTLWCNPSATCYGGGNNRETVCQTSIWASAGASAFECGNCLPTYNNCDTDNNNCEIKNGNSCGTNSVYNGCDGSPGPGVEGNCICSSGFYDCTGGSYDGHCERSQGSSCFIGELEGTWQCSTGAGSCWVDSITSASCECILSIQIFETGKDAKFSTSSPLLWGTQYGDGDLLRLSKNDISTSTFTISNSGQVGIGLTSISNDVAFEVSSTDRGVLLSRLTTAQRDGISDPSDGLLIYNINTYQFEYFNGATWRSIDTTSTYSALSNGGLSLNSNNEFSVNFDELTLTTSSGKLAINYDSNIFKTNTLGGLSLKYDEDFFSIDSITGLMFRYDPDFFASSTDGMRLVEMGNVVSSTYGNSTTAVTLSIDNYGRITFVGTSTIMVDINNIINSSSLARVDMENTFASPTIFSASTTFSATTTHNAGVRANLYCDSSGTNCFDPSLGWVTTVLDVTTTPATTTGSFTFTTGTLRGYQAGNAICNHYYPGYHFCFSGEIISYIRTAPNINKFADLPSQAWIAEGPPGFTSDSNDCGGYTTADLEPLGAFWEFDSDGGGRGWLSTCGSAKNIACCK